MAAPLRTCVACRTRRPASELMRLAVQGDRVVVDRGGTLGGRGAWICPDRACADEATRKFGRVRHLLRYTANRRPPDLRGQLADTAREAVLEGLLPARRAGAISAGPARLLAHPSGIAAIITASDAPAELRARIAATFPDLPMVDLGLDATALGKKLGTGPRSAVGVHAGRQGAGLLGWLQRRARLG